MPSTSVGDGLVRDRLLGVYVDTFELSIELSAIFVLVAGAFVVLFLGIASTEIGALVVWPVDESSPEPPADPNRLPLKLEAKVITGAALVGEAGETSALEKLDVVAAGTTTGVALLVEGCGAIAEQGGPLAQPVMTS